MPPRITSIMRFASFVAIPAVLGFLFPLWFTRRITLIGLLVWFGGLWLGIIASGYVGKYFGLWAGIATAIGCNIAIAIFWIWLVFQVSAWVHQDDSK